MEDYQCAVRTNLFHVKDGTQFETLIRDLNFYGNQIILWKGLDKAGVPVYRFGCRQEIAGIPRCDDDGEENWDGSYDNFLDALSYHVADGDAIIILEAGNEGLEKVEGYASVVTSQSSRQLWLSECATHLAREMLGQSEWKPCDPSK